MRVLLSNLAIVSALSAPGIAFAAAETVTGTVKTYSPLAMTPTLSDGTAYMLPKGFKDPGLKAGEKVSISYDMVGKKHEAKTVKILQQPQQS
ncbi:uncharacterized protein DUF1344 [Rhizobium subbaraonis]|uniref:Uncharacterized protein DUF1344 n=1 Tax=Rhizobium subbaraonis TaxID=908946 RepID=A0A285U0I1_9HYPH|nr:DUF1344 domain-containing protein [Rhizobium subbaraonis]SOC35342.1 uncharacterized protein DUF1344 [Rhizobium subbaraonis]